jgi:hypothetical protein
LLSAAEAARFDVLVMTDQTFLINKIGPGVALSEPEQTLAIE